MIMSLKQKKITFKTKDKIEPQSRHNHRWKKRLPLVLQLVK